MTDIVQSKELKSGRVNWFFLISMLLFISISSYGQGGLLLRGEKWQKFDLKNATADFYVATNGNDSWSGTLAAPNANKTDGPFATIEKAQKAVRKLKADVYKPKKDPVETRWIGSPHELGKGKDIVILIRNGYYSLEKPLVFYPEDGGERVETNLPTGAFEYHKLRDHYVTYAAYPGEKPIISGGKRISDWKQNGTIWKTNVSDHKVEALLVNGKLQTLARTPNT